MSEFAKELYPITLEDEIKRSYLDYAMSVIVGRALPDVRDGLKPVHRRVLYAMHELKNDWNKPYKKSARVVGDVIGKYHPHGESAVYDTIVRMAQPFSLRYMLVDGQGNFGSVDGDSPAAMRYTEVRMSKLAHALLEDIEKDTVDFVPNYDETEFIPDVLPTRIPNLLVNGSSGIAVGMATNIPPHNLSEIIDACIALIQNPDCTVDDLMDHVKGPDFPTAGIINGRLGIVQAYHTGRGKIYIRARAEIECEKEGGKESIIVSELPYQVNKARLMEKIASLVKETKIDGITAIRDESDREGMRMVIEVRRGENAEVLLNNLYTQTQMQSVFGINIVTLSNGQPRVMNLKQLVEAFIDHRRDIVTRRTLFQLRKARKRAHILEGLGIALVNIDPIIALIKASPSPTEAKVGLLAQAWPAGLVADLLGHEGATHSRPEGLLEEYGMAEEGLYRLSPDQAQAILDLKLHRLTGLEKDKIFDEYKEILNTIKELLDILANPDHLMQVIQDELLEVKKDFGDERCSEIIDSQLDLTNEDLIPQEEVVVTISQRGYVKTQVLDHYDTQKRGGKGKAAAKIKDEDYIRHILVANTHDTLLYFSDLGRVYWLKVYHLPQVGRGGRGKPLVNFLPLSEEETITAILPLKEYTADYYLFMATAMGTVKKVPLDLFSNPRSTGVIAVNLFDEDRLVGVDISHGDHDVMLFTDAGKVIRFQESDVRPMGRTARGVRGVRLKPGQKVVSLVVAKGDNPIITATENGYGKRTPVGDFRRTGRGGQGVIAIQVSERNGKVVGAFQCADEDEMLLISEGGLLVRTPVKQVSLVGRNTQGVRLIRLDNDDHLLGIQQVDGIMESETTEEEGNGSDSSDT